VEGHNLILERRSPEGHYERAGDIVAELVRLKVDVMEALGVTLMLAEHTARQYADAFALINGANIDALFVSWSPPAFADRAHIVDFATRMRLPSNFAYREPVELGGLLSYGVNLADLFRRAAGYVDKILQGANPAELPVERPTKFELVINLKTAMALRLTIPPSLLAIAHEVIG
jgi:putative ABC transport system substrate-binding protein